MSVYLITLPSCLVLAFSGICLSIARASEIYLWAIKDLHFSFFTAFTTFFMLFFLAHALGQQGGSEKISKERTTSKAKNKTTKITAATATTSRMTTTQVFLLLSAATTCSVLFFSHKLFDEPLLQEFLEEYNATTNKRLAGKTVLITGANSGVGLESAIWASSELGNAKTVFLGTRNVQKCEEAKRKILERLVPGDKKLDQDYFIAPPGRSFDTATASGAATVLTTPSEAAALKEKIGDRLKCFNFELIPIDKQKIELEIKKTLEKTNVKVDILVSNAGFAGGRNHHAMYISHKILQTLLKMKSNRNLKTVTVSSMTAWLFCALPSVYFHYSILQPFVRNFVDGMCGVAAEEIKNLKAKGLDVQLPVFYPRVKFWQVLGGDTEDEIAVPLAFVRTSINPGLMDSFLGENFMRTAKIGALPIVKAVLMLAEEPNATTGKSRAVVDKKMDEERLEPGKTNSVQEQKQLPDTSTTRASTVGREPTCVHHDLSVTNYCFSDDFTWSKGSCIDFVEEREKLDKLFAEEFFS
ncbi:unnamed protein product [Amoebophrya sp. A120]|nr:unnamed protein product [Amoebophrya sp. A120]|eukprot:GSA120T00022196001.1